MPRGQGRLGEEGMRDLHAHCSVELVRRPLDETVAHHIMELPIGLRRVGRPVGVAADLDGAAGEVIEVAAAQLVGVRATHQGHGTRGAEVAEGAACKVHALGALEVKRTIGWRPQPRGLTRG